MLRYAVVVALWVASACGPDTIEVTYDPCSPLAVTAVPGTDTQEVRSVEAAVQAWSRVLPTRIEVRGGSEERAGLRVVFENDTFYRAMYWDTQGEISIGRDNLAAADYAVAIAHELGHAFGLAHVSRDARASVMNVGNLEVEPTEQDGAAVRDLWEACGAAAGD